MIRRCQILTAGDWVDASGLIPGNPGFAAQAQAATQEIMSGQ